MLRLETIAHHQETFCFFVCLASLLRWGQRCSLSMLIIVLSFSVHAYVVLILMLHLFHAIIRKDVWWRALLFLLLVSLVFFCLGCERMTIRWWRILLGVSFLDTVVVEDEVGIEAASK